MTLKLYSFPLILLTQILISQELDSSLTLGKKSLMILPTTEEVYYDISNKMLSIIADQATELGRFEVIDRNIVDEILLEQKFQLSGMVSDKQIVEIGELAAAEEALILTIINFGQKGVLKETKKKKEEKEEDKDDSTLFTWLVKTIVTESIESSKKIDTTKLRLELENNIHTEFRGSIKLVNVVSGISEQSFNISASFTGGNRSASLSKVLDLLSSQIGHKLKELYMITSEVIDVDGRYISIFTGEDLGLKNGTMFEIASKDKERTYKGRTVNIPGKSRGLIQISDVGPDASRAKVVRKWRTIRPGNKVYELKSPATVTDIGFSYSAQLRYEMVGKLRLYPFNDLSGSLNGYLGSIKDSRETMDGYLGLGLDIDYTFLEGFGTNSSIAIALPALFAFTTDDDGHGVVSFFSGPSINLNFAIQINQKRDIVFTVSNIFTDVHGPWQYQEKTNENDDDGNAITETTSAIWDKDAPIISASGIYFSIALRKINF